jgi:hypothetical protein
VKSFYFLMLAISITGACFAQRPLTTNGEKIFELSPDIFQRRFIIELGKGNKLQIELNDMADLALFKNMDSVLRVFLQDMEPFQDSLGDPLSSKRIDYLADSSGRKKIRIQQFMPKGSSYLVQRGETASLKLEQDTVNFIGAVPFRAKYTLRKAFMDIRHYRLSFYVNNIVDLKNYIGSGLNEKIISLQKNVNAAWTSDKKGMYIDKDHTIKANQPGGYIGLGDFLVLRVAVNLQNYKSYFVPSCNIGVALILSHNNFKRDIGLFWEPNFLFAGNAQGKLQTYRNDFLTLTFGQGPVKDHDPRKESYFLTVLSLGYLINQKGDYFDKCTIRLGAGALSLFDGKTKIEPILYFNSFFKGVTPGIRWTQAF